MLTYQCFVKLVWPVRQIRPSWSGFMQAFSKEECEFSGKSSISSLPMIDLLSIIMMIENAVIVLPLEKGLLLKQMELCHGEIDAHEHTPSIEKNEMG